MAEEEKLKLGKGAAFVKSRLQPLPQGDDTWAADFRALPRPITQTVTHYQGMVVTLPDGALQTGYAGIRPKIAPPGAPPQDFLVLGPRDHGAPGVINLFGIESPGLTASLALADLVREIASDH